MNLSQQVKDSYMSFMVGGRHYAVCVIYVLEVVVADDISPLPGTPEYVEGIMNFRNEVLPVINMRKRLSIVDLNAQKNPNKYAVVFDIETQAGQKRFCLLVDKVINVEEFTKNDIKTIDNLQNTASAAPYIKGVVNSDNGEFVYVIIPEKIISKQDMESLQNIMENSQIINENNENEGFEFF